MLRTRTRLCWLLLASLVAGGVFAGLGLLTTRAQGTLSAHAAGKPQVDASYANGTVVYMIGPHMDTSPNPNLLAHAPELYILAYPVNLDPTCIATCPPVTVGNHYQPQCNPCFHPGLPPVFAYHDHVLTGAPGFGTHGTAGEFKGPGRLVRVLDTPEEVKSPRFQPFTTEEGVDAAQAVGEFLPISSGPNPYEVEPGILLICPLVSSHA